MIKLSRDEQLGYIEKLWGKWIVVNLFPNNHPDYSSIDQVQQSGAIRGKLINVCSANITVRDGWLWGKKTIIPFGHIANISKA